MHCRLVLVSSVYDDSRDLPRRSVSVSNGGKSETVSYSCLNVGL